MGKKPPYEIGKDGLGVLDVVRDIHGWVDAKVFRPFPYDLVNMKLQEQKVIAGWWTGLKWEGLRLKAKDKVVLWKDREQWEE